MGKGGFTLRDKVVQHLRVREPVDGEEEEDFAGGEGRLELVDEAVVPGDARAVVQSKRPRFVDIKAVACCDPERAETVADDAALGRLDYVAVLTPDQHAVPDAEHDEGQEIRAPEPDVQFEQRRCDCRHRAHVDAGGNLLANHSPQVINRLIRTTCSKPYKSAAP